MILERGTGWDAYNFAVDIAGADIQALQQVILERGDGCDAYCFAKDIDGADVDALQKVLLKTGGGFAVYKFAKDIDGADVVALRSRLVELHATGDDSDTLTGDGDYLDRFNTDADIQKKLKEQMDKVSKKNKPA